MCDIFFIFNLYIDLFYNGSCKFANINGCGLHFGERKAAADSVFLQNLDFKKNMHSIYRVRSICACMHERVCMCTVGCMDAIELASVLTTATVAL